MYYYENLINNIMRSIPLLRKGGVFPNPKSLMIDRISGIHKINSERE